MSANLIGHSDHEDRQGMVGERWREVLRLPGRVGTAMSVNRRSGHDEDGGSARDDLARFVREQTRAHEQFPSLMAEARERKRLLAAITEARRAAGLSQTHVAARMNTSASAVARLEAGEIDPKLSTVFRYVSAVGRRLDWKLTAEEGERSA
ncbi:MAG TPA: helix-turn-helix transcriptional regulator [Candidatus Sulfotelmatobacter sp.]|nr:helix-turn-helix transcriptional regulator [Candidatus Sulfotelmatobacter sp.]